VRFRAAVIAFAALTACAKEKPAADTSAAAVIPTVAPDTLKAATKTLGRDSVHIGPIGVLPADPKKKPQ
jgi:hypothetical protein